MYGGHRIDQVKSVSYEQDDSLIYTDDSKDKKSFNIELYPLGFDLYAHAIETGEMTLSMNSGACSGCQFKVLGINNLRYTAHDVYFAIAGNTTYNESDFRLFYDKVLWQTMVDAIDYTPVVNFTDPEDVIWANKIKNYIKGKIINGKSVAQLLKEYIDYIIQSEDVYCSIANTVLPQYYHWSVGNNVFNSMKLS